MEFNPLKFILQKEPLINLYVGSLFFLLVQSVELSKHPKRILLILKLVMLYLIMFFINYLFIKLLNLFILQPLIILLLHF